MKHTFSILLLLCFALQGWAQTQLVSANTLRALKNFKIDTVTVTKITKVIDATSTDRHLPTAKSVWTLFNLGDTDGTDDITDATALSGDLSGLLPAPTVDGLQGRPVASTAPTTGQVLKWSGTDWAPAGGTIAEYAVTVTSGNAGATLRVVASGTGVTAAYASGEITVTVPAGVTLLSASYRGAFGDVQGAADTGGATNWVRLKFAGLEGNTSTSDLRVPIIQKTIFASGSPSLTAPYTINQSNNPAQAVVGVATGSITLRFSGMGGATNGYQITASGF